MIGHQRKLLMTGHERFTVVSCEATHDCYVYARSQTIVICDRSRTIVKCDRSGKHSS